MWQEGDLRERIATQRSGLEVRKERTISPGHGMVIYHFVCDTVLRSTKSKTGSKSIDSDLFGFKTLHAKKDLMGTKVCS